MKIALTGGTGFLGRYIVRELLGRNYSVKAWRRASSCLDDISSDVEWINGELNNSEATAALLDGVDAVVHSGLYRVGDSFRGGVGDILDFLERNFLGSIRLMEEAYSRGIEKFIFISSCAVHEVILEDRPLDEAHPLWPQSHYGAHKAAIEKFVHSYGFQKQFKICAIRPTGIYGLAYPLERSKWFDLISAVARGESVDCTRGGKEVHAADVAKAVGLLLEQDFSPGEVYNCYDRYVSEYEVAEIAGKLTNSGAVITGERKIPKHQIVKEKIQGLGFEFGGDELLHSTIDAIIQKIPPVSN